MMNKITQIQKTVFTGVFVCFSILLQVAYSQNIIEIKGTVTDKADKNPLESASVFLAKSKTGSFTNSKGEFVLKLEQPAANDTLCVTFTGYAVWRKPLAQIKNYTLNIDLETSTLDLKTIVITPVEGKKLLQDAIASIPKNYLPVNASLTGFYRETVTKGKQVVELNEGVLKTFTPAYLKPKQAAEVEIIKARALKKLPQSSEGDTLPLIKSGPYGMASKSDIVRLSHTFLSKDFLADNKFTLDGAVWYEGKQCYVVSFKPIDEGNIEGKIYITTHKLAIAKLEAHTIKAIDKGKLFSIWKWKSRVMSVEYTEKEGDWYLNRTSVSGVIENKNNNQQLVLKANYVTTAITTANVKPIDNKKKVTPHEALIENVSDATDAFWENYNFVKSE